MLEAQVLAHHMMQLSWQLTEAHCEKCLLLWHASILTTPWMRGVPEIRGAVQANHAFLSQVEQPRQQRGLPVMAGCWL